jgi:hypothetical protein
MTTVTGPATAARSIGRVTALLPAGRSLGGRGNGDRRGCALLCLRRGVAGRPVLEGQVEGVWPGQHLPAVRCAEGAPLLPGEPGAGASPPPAGAAARGRVRGLRRAVHGERASALLQACVSPDRRPGLEGHRGVRMVRPRVRGPGQGPRSRWWPVLLQVARATGPQLTGGGGVIASGGILCSHSHPRTPGSIAVKRNAGIQPHQSR